MSKAHNGMFKGDRSPFLQRQFRREDFTSMEGGTYTGPDFIGIGYKKAGTTWWSNAIFAHPAVIPNRLQQKELHFFTYLQYRPISEEERALYHEAFSRPEGTVTGEFTPSYVFRPLVLENIAATVPDIHLILIVRNPIDVALSSLHNHQQRDASFLELSGEKLTFAEVFHFFPATVNQSYFRVHIPTLLSLFSRDQILLLQYEQNVRYPRREIQRTYAFLGVDPTFVPENIEHMGQRSGRVDPPDADRLFLAKHLKPDVDVLCQYFPESIDRDLWPEFK